MKAKVQNSALYNAPGRRFQSKNRSLTLNHNKSTVSTPKVPQQKSANTKKEASDFLEKLTPLVATTPAIAPTITTTTTPTTTTTSTPQRKFRVVRSSSHGSANAPETPCLSTPASTLPVVAPVSLVRPPSPVQPTTSAATTPTTTLTLETNSTPSEAKKRSSEESEQPQTPTIIKKRLRISPPQSPRSPSSSSSSSSSEEQSNSLAGSPPLSPVAHCSTPTSPPLSETEHISPPPSPSLNSTPISSSPPSPITPSHSSPSTPIPSSHNVEIPITPLPHSSCNTTKDYIEEWMEEEEVALKSSLLSSTSLPKTEEYKHDLSWAEDW